MSAGAFAAGVTVTVHADLAGAISGLTWLSAATARQRGVGKRVTNAPGAAAQAVTRAAQGLGRAGILFGGEKSGLPNEAVALADEVMTYPVDPDFSSLNLAQAVGVFCAAWGQLQDAHVKPADTLAPPASRDELMRMFEHFETELERAGFFYPPEKTPLMKDNLRAAFIRADWTQQEVQTFRGAIKALTIGRGKARVTRPD